MAEDSSRFGPSVLDAVLSAVLRQNPTARVVALDEQGNSAAIPESLQLDRHSRVKDVAGAFDLVDPSDAEVVTAAWRMAKRVGAAQASARFRSDDESRGIVYFVDGRHRHGVFVGVIVTDRDHLLPDLGQELIRPRHCAVKTDETGMFLEVDTATTQILGWSSEELLGRKATDILHPDDLPQAIATWVEVLTAPNVQRRARFRHRHHDGFWVWLEVTIQNHLNDPKCPHLTSEMLDIADEIATQEALRLSEQSLLRLADALPFGVLQVDREHRVLYRNERLSQVVGRRSGTTAEQQLVNLVPPDRDQVYAALRQVLEQGTDQDLEVTLKNRRGERHCSVALRALTGEHGAVSGAIMCVADVTDDVQMRQELRTRANFDRLTRCYNRASIMSNLDSMLLEAYLRESGTCAVFVDIDHFKPINDELGHAAGDALLKLIAERLLDSVRSEDRVGRLGGDEFLVTCPDVKTPEDGMAIAQRLADAISQPVEIAGRALTPSASIGVSWCAGGSDNAEAMVERADAAMYISKSERKGRPVLGSVRPSP